MLMTEQREEVWKCVVPIICDVFGLDYETTHDETSLLQETHVEFELCIVALDVELREEHVWYTPASEKVLSQTQTVGQIVTLVQNDWIEAGALSFAA
jgi:hypothetical protein